MSHFHVRRWQDGVGTSAFSLFLQRFILITITYVIRIEGRRGSLQVPASALSQLLGVCVGGGGGGRGGGGSLPKGEALFPSHCWPAQGRTLAWMPGQHQIQANQGRQGALLSSQWTRPNKSV